MKFKHVCIALLLTLACRTHTAQAQANNGSVFVSFGLKFGYAFGLQGGFIYGFEASMTDWTKQGIYGFIIDVDFHRNMQKVHIGGQAGLAFGGVSFGPTIARYTNNRRFDIGFTATAFSGAIFYPYYSFTFLTRIPRQHEVGTFLKLPMHIATIKEQQ